MDLSIVYPQLHIQFRQPCAFPLKLRLLGERLSNLAPKVFHLLAQIVKLGAKHRHPVRHLVQGVVDAEQITQHIIAQFGPVGHLAFEGQDKGTPEVLHGQGHRKAAIGADFHRLPRLDSLTDFRNQGLARLHLIGKGLVPDHHTGEALLDLHSWRGGCIGRGIGGGCVRLFPFRLGRGSGLYRHHRMGMLRQRFHIRLQPHDKALVFLDSLGEVFQKIVLHTVLLALMVRFQQPQAGHVNIQVHLLFYQRISSAQGLDLRIGEGGLVHILTGAHRGF